MSEPRPFKPVIFQWLRLLLDDHTLSPRAVQFATYLAVVRCNSQSGKAWPSHATVCKDLGLKSTRTVQRLNRELDGTWFRITRSRGLKNSTQYVPHESKLRKAWRLREQEEGNRPIETAGYF